MYYVLMYDCELSMMVRISKMLTSYDEAVKIAKSYSVMTEIRKTKL